MSPHRAQAARQAARSEVPRESSFRFAIENFGEWDSPRRRHVLRGDFDTRAFECAQLQFFSGGDEDIPELLVAAGAVVHAPDVYAPDRLHALCEAEHAVDVA